MSPEKKEALKALAQAASPGIWHVSHSTPVASWAAVSGGGTVLTGNAHPLRQKEAEANIRFACAAYPEAILDLLAENERLTILLHSRT